MANLTLLEATARELVRVAKLSVEYENIGPAGQFGLTNINREIEEACKAFGSGDLIQLMAASVNLKGIE